MEKKNNNRLEIIIKLLETCSGTNIAEIIQGLDAALGKKISKITVNRDLAKLLEQKLIKRTGKGPATGYQLSPGHKLFKHIDVKEYFKNDYENRSVAKNFNFDIFNILKEVEIFNREEMDNLFALNKKFQNNVKNLTADIIKREYERLTIELSWKSSQIEGNTYTLLETENLLKNHQESSGRTKEEALMIINHKEAFDYINKNKNEFKNITVEKIENVHCLLTKEMGIERNIRKRIVGIIGTGYRPLDNEFQIKESLAKASEIVNSRNDAFTKAVLLNLLIAYIQPFNDGNKRTSRLMGNAALMANNICPLSFRSIDELEYKKAMILFYEQNNIGYFKDLFMEQYKFSVENYF